MFNKIKEFFTSSKPTVAVTQEVPLTALDVAVKNIKETTDSVTAKVEVVPIGTEASVSAPAPEKEQTWTKKPAPSIAKTAKPKQQSVKTSAAAAKKRPPTPK
jgi:hypothetical protein